MRSLVWLPALLIVVLAACTRTDGKDAPPPVPSANAPAPLASAPKAPAPSASASAPATGCVGLEKAACVLRAGCVLDQPGGGKSVCRDAQGPCERAVLQGEVIGTDVPGVTEEASKRAEQTCNATAGCTVGGGKCSCPCAVFTGRCNCNCGGGYLRRCMYIETKNMLGEFPPK